MVAVWEKLVGQEHPSVTDPVASMAPGFRKNVTVSANFPLGCPFILGRCFAFC